MQLRKGVQRNKIINTKWQLKPKHINTYEKDKTSFKMLENYNCIEK